jgi:hypothetical protein
MAVQVVRSGLRYGQLGVYFVHIFTLMLTSANSYKIVNVGGIFYMLNSGTVRIMHKDSLKAFGVDNSDSVTVLQNSSLGILEEFVHLPPVPLVKMREQTCDEAMLVAIQKAEILSVPKKVPYTLEYLGHYINPAVTYFRGRLLLGVSLHWWGGWQDGRLPNNHMAFRWVNHTLSPFYSRDPFLGINANVLGELENSTVDNNVVIGQDPRLLVLSDDRVGMAFDVDNKHMSYAVLTYNKSTDAMDISELHYKIRPNMDAHKNQKNWTPFLHNGNRTYLIQYVNPLHVVRVVPRRGYEADTETVSLSHKADTPNWLPEYGEWRGGTNAVLIGDRYLSFFHTSTTLPHNCLRTYLFGAFTFSKDPPFRILQYSPQPLLFDNRLYTGAWNPIKNRKIDYVVFPVSCFLYRRNNSVGNKFDDLVYVSLGYNDKEAFLVSFQLSNLIDSLVAVE